MVKLNTDVAVNLETRRASSGCVIQDAGGQFLGACRMEINGVIDITAAEAQALRDGLPAGGARRGIRLHGGYTGSS